MSAEDAGETFHTITLELPPDGRADFQRCCICLRTLHPQRKTRLGAEYACRCCASLFQPEPWILEYWLAVPPQVRRRRLAMHFGIDPATRSVALAEVEFTSVSEDVDGLPNVLEVSHHRGRIPTFGIPECYWSLARERQL
jgi:hypothetical protein